MVDEEQVDVFEHVRGAVSGTLVPSLMNGSSYRCYCLLHYHHFTTTPPTISTATPSPPPRRQLREMHFAVVVEGSRLSDAKPLPLPLPLFDSPRVSVYPSLCMTCMLQSGRCIRLSWPGNPSLVQSVEWGYTRYGRYVLTMIGN